jgi:hypothetical protein
VFVTLWFAEAFLCAVERRRGVMLGMELLRPSDACCFVFEGGMLRDAEWIGDTFLLLTRCFVFVCRLATAAARRRASRPFLFLVWAAGSR